MGSNVLIAVKADGVDRVYLGCVPDGARMACRA